MSEEKRAAESVFSLRWDSGPAGGKDESGKHQRAALCMWMKHGEQPRQRRRRREDENRVCVHGLKSPSWTYFGRKKKVPARKCNSGNCLFVMSQREPNSRRHLSQVNANTSPPSAKRHPNDLAIYSPPRHVEGPAMRRLSQGGCKHGAN